MTNPEPNSSFLPDTQIQFAWDSTSLGALKHCPYFYETTIIKGYVPRVESVHLTFGILFHSALERYDHLRVDGIEHEPALRHVVRWTLGATWNKALNRGWISDLPEKNRLTLIRSIVWYLDEFAQDPLETVTLASGKPAVELSFRFETNLDAAYDQPYLLCGHLDRVATLNSETYIVDRKTTKTTLSPSYFERYTPDNQFSMYALAGRLAFGLPLSGLIVDAAQVAVTFTRFQRQIIPRPAEVLDEWLEDTMEWISLAKRWAETGRWPRNDRSCGAFGGCPLRGICSRSPLSRGEWLERGFAKRQWDPMKVRGDI